LDLSLIIPALFLCVRFFLCVVQYWYNMLMTLYKKKRFVTSGISLFRLNLHIFLFRMVSSWIDMIHIYLFSLFLFIVFFCMNLNNYSYLFGDFRTKLFVQCTVFFVHGFRFHDKQLILAFHWVANCQSVFYSQPSIFSHTYLSFLYLEI